VDVPLSRLKKLKSINCARVGSIEEKKGDDEGSRIRGMMKAVPING
jgi:hypothetical protein